MTPTLAPPTDTAVVPVAVSVSVLGLLGLVVAAISGFVDVVTADTADDEVDDVKGAAFGGVAAIVAFVLATHDAASLMVTAGGTVAASTGAACVDGLVSPDATGAGAVVALLLSGAAAPASLGLVGFKAATALCGGVRAAWARKL